MHEFAHQSSGGEAIRSTTLRPQPSIHGQRPLASICGSVADGRRPLGVRLAGERFDETALVGALSTQRSASTGQAGTNRVVEAFPQTASYIPSLTATLRMSPSSFIRTRSWMSRDPAAPGARPLRPAG
jgi:hypothetical protein